MMDIFEYLEKTDNTKIKKTLKDETELRIEYLYDKFSCSKDSDSFKYIRYYFHEISDKLKRKVVIKDTDFGLFLNDIKIKNDIILFMLNNLDNKKVTKLLRKIVCDEGYKISYRSKGKKVKSITIYPPIPTWVCVLRLLGLALISLAVILLIIHGCVEIIRFAFGTDSASSDLFRWTYGVE